MPLYRDGKVYPSHTQEETQDAPAPSQLAPATQLERSPDCRNFKDTPAFGILCSTMDRLRNEKPAKRIDTLTRERPVYHLKEANLARAYTEVLGLDKHGDAAKRLKNWKTPVDGQVGSSSVPIADTKENASGDFARVAYHEIKSRSTVEQGSLTIGDVNDLLDKLAGPNVKTADVVAILRTVNEKATAAEQEWIIRIILKAGTLFNVCSDLKRVCWTLYEPDIKLEKHCFLPQLCHRSPNSNHDAIAKLVGGPSLEFIMEEKLDGERIQLHMRGGGAEWFYCSRKAKDYIKVFDILYLNGKCLTDRRLDERKKLLRSPRLFSNLDAFKGRLEFVEERRGRTGKDIRNFLEEILEQKILISWYLVAGGDREVARGRFPACFVVCESPKKTTGAESGRGEKHSRALADSRFTTLCKVGSGMTLADYEWILGHEVADATADVYIEPEHSFVIAVKASEIVFPATGYGSGYTLRFPRCRYIFWDRESRSHPSSDETQDRDMWNCLSLQEFTEALQNKENKRYTDDDQGTFFVVASEDAESQRAFTQTLAEYDAKLGSSNADSKNEEMEEEEEDDEQSAVADAVDKADVFATKQLVDWGMGDDDGRTPSFSPTLRSAAADDSDASSHDEAEDQEEYEEEEEEEEREEEAGTREMSPTLPAPSTGSDPQASQAAQEDDGEGYRPLFPVAQAGKESQMSGEAMEYDEDSLFATFTFYIDTPENAELNDLASSSPPSAAIERLDKVAGLLTEHGGRIVTNLMDATHVIMDDEDSAPDLRPKRKYIVTPSWVEECVDEDTLVDEDSKTSQTQSALMTKSEYQGTAAPSRYDRRKPIPNLSGAGLSVGHLRPGAHISTAARETM
ncbi:hypothetical protein A1Q1_03481 [Trichosporon asahii var. asahii CBS 2479]|uniref:DNA ligase IV n=1 Tax=Trichosporon asahii var. asahii (strain ATCC 90039 / CBS 2479 / JCM 2466 / KCTC 7840 / NBRC 103889/ NCYC 2677 / UAMH 7654) TaxID=1186058 RepID=J6ET21_TRIAS|nr:hypothetical protein A1Q1_03481 [Trichosporon asahii var. asahii CBS 2479]EJT47704.1 hypothetical protein A1Q1_03481 [Trichosporon asahii var. asahii CBS 2479]